MHLTDVRPAPWHFEFRFRLTRWAILFDQTVVVRANWRTAAFGYTRVDLLRHCFELIYSDSRPARLLNSSRLISLPASSVTVTCSEA